MKKFLPLFLSFSVITLSVLFNILANFVRQWTSINYNLSLGYFVNIIAIIIIAILFALSLKFSINNKTEIILLLAFIILGILTSYLLASYIGISYLTIFVSVAYITELLFKKLSHK